MTLTRLREIVTAMRSPEGCACGIAEMSDAFLLLADLAGIGREDADLDGFVVRAMAATHGPWTVVSAIDDDPHDTYPVCDIDGEVVHAPGEQSASATDAAHIAGASPDRVLALAVRR